MHRTKKSRRKWYINAYQIQLFQSTLVDILNGYSEVRLRVSSMKVTG
jgi:hypothetical protein